MVVVEWQREMNLPNDMVEVEVMPGVTGPMSRNATHNNLVDPASSHTLVSKIKPCMCKYKQLTLKLRMAHYISYSLFDAIYYLDNRSNSRANTW